GGAMLVACDLRKVRGDARERPVTFVVIEEARIGGGRGADEEVEIPVVVVVAPGAVPEPGRCRHEFAVGDLRERLATSRLLWARCGATDGPVVPTPCTTRRAAGASRQVGFARSIAPLCGSGDLGAARLRAHSHGR